MKLFKRRQRRRPAVPQLPEFGVRVVLREGDKIVRRGAGGEIRIQRITQASAQDLGRLRVE